MLKRDTTEECPCCDCTPCDCHGIGEDDELWRMGQNPSDQGRKNPVMVGQRDWSQSKSDIEMETGQHSKNGILSEGDQSGCTVTKETIQSSSETWCFLYWDCHR